VLKTLSLLACVGFGLMYVDAPKRKDVAAAAAARANA
jgi:hypothetical protein